MKRDTRIQLIALLVMVGCMAASAGLAVNIAASSGRNRLVYTDRAEDGDPPQVGLGIAMGAFRGLFVNILWLRANELKEDGKYYEAVDLAKAITKLQPRFPRVWAFHAWNLAYNISVATQTPEERWGWVQSGIRLLRDEGIPRNPNDVLLHKELGWIFLHKVQGFMDDANDYYKRRHAAEWTVALGPPPARTAALRSTEAATEAYAAWLSRIAGAPDTLEGVIEADPRVGPLVERLRVETGLGLDERLLEAVEARRTVLQLYVDLPTVGLPPEAAGDPLFRIMAEEEDPFAGSLIPHVRKRVLIDRYRMEPERMVRYTRRYGPLDWRHAAAHALYWADRGVEEATLRITDRNRADFDLVNTDRIVIQALQELYRSGSVQFDLGNTGFYLALPSADYIVSYGEKLEELTKRNTFVDAKTGQLVDMEDRAYSFYAAGYENFLKDAIRFLYRRGQKAEAEEYYRKLRLYPANTNDPMRSEKLSLPLAEFVKAEVEEDGGRFDSPDVARAEIVGSLQGAFVQGLLENDRELFDSLYGYARDFHAWFVRKQMFEVIVNRGEGARMQVMDQDFDSLAGKILAVLALTAGPADGARMYQRAPEEIRLPAYAVLETTRMKADLDAQAAAGEGPGFDIWFPPPEGIEGYRKAMEAQRQQDEAERAKVELE